MHLLEKTFTYPLTADLRSTRKYPNQGSGSKSPWVVLILLLVVSLIFPPPKFVTVTSFLAFSLAATQTTIETEYWTERMVAVSSVWTLKTITNTDLKRAQTAELIQVRTPTKCLWAAFTLQNIRAFENRLRICNQLSNIYLY